MAHSRDPVRPKARLDTEPAVQTLLLCPKETGRIGHRDDLGPVDFVALSAANDRREALGKHVFQPVGTFTVGEGYVDGAVVVNSGNWGLVQTALFCGRRGTRQTCRNLACRLSAEQVGA